MLKWKTMEYCAKIYYKLELIIKWYNRFVAYCVRAAP